MGISGSIIEGESEGGRDGWEPLRLGSEWDEEGESGRGESWGGPQQSESRRSPAGQGMRVGNGGVGERAGCCGLKSALRGSHSGECGYGNAGWF